LAVRFLMGEEIANHAPRSWQPGRWPRPRISSIRCCCCEPIRFLRSMN
jgi:hypothetical protein